MRITPIVHHACARLPQLTSKFSDVLLADMSATPGGDTDIVCQAAHNQTIGENIAICISGAETQITITDAQYDANDNVILTFDGPHGLVDNATAIGVNSWNPEIELTGFSDSLMNATHEFLSKVSETKCLIAVPEGATLGLTGSAAMINKNDDRLNGWHPVEIIDATTLRMPTPAVVDAATIAQSVTVAFNIRAWGALDFEIIKAKYTGEQALLAQATLAIAPLPTVPLSKDRGAKTSAYAELDGSTVIRQMMLDGFHVVVTIPTTDTFGGLAAADLCHGELLDVVLRTFQGYRPDQPDLEGVNPFSAVLSEHGGMSFDRAFYAHDYKFEAPYNLSNANAMLGMYQTAGAQHEAIDPEQVQPAQPVGTVPFNELSFEGIYNGEFGQPLTGNVKYENQA